MSNVFRKESKNKKNLITKISGISMMWKMWLKSNLMNKSIWSVIFRTVYRARKYDIILGGCYYEDKK